MLGLTLVYDGILAFVLLAAAMGWGAYLPDLLRIPRIERALHLGICLALGLGVTGFMTLGLALAGWLHGLVGWGLVLAGLSLGSFRWQQWSMVALRRMQEKRDKPPTPIHVTERDPPAMPTQLQTLAGIAIAPTLAMLLFTSTLAPGFVWDTEANGYDVISYHLQGPREWYEAGAMEFAPHNVYLAFPQQLEIHYLLLMHLLGGPYEAAVASQLFHASLMIATIAVLATVWRDPWARWSVAVLGASVPWLVIVGSLAYVESGLLLYAAIGLLLARRQLMSPETARWQNWLVVGLCGGLAGACKYTGLVLVGVASIVAVALAHRAPFLIRLATVLVIGTGCTLGVAPWLARNAAWTGNPVYPFAYEIFGGAAWSPDQDQQWARGHHVPADEANPLGYANLFVTQLLDVQLYGFGVLLLGAVGILLAPLGRMRLMLGAVVAVMLGTWIGMTYMPGRFILTLVVPLLISVGQAFDRLPRATEVGTAAYRGGRRLRSALLLVSCTAAVVAASFAHQRLLRADRDAQSSTGLPLERLINVTNVIAANHPLVVATPENSYIWMIGSAQAFYVDRNLHYTAAFNRDPLVELAANGATAEQCVTWLEERGVTHVFIDRNEVRRLRDTYGFSPQVNEEWYAELMEAGLEPILPETDNWPLRRWWLLSVPGTLRELELPDEHGIEEIVRR